MAAPYIQPSEASNWLDERYEIEGEPLIGFLILASDEVDTRGGPFIGAKYDLTDPVQTRQFPRDVTPTGEATPLDAEDNPVIPDEVLDFVSLRAYQLSIAEPNVPVISESVGSLSITYAKPKADQLYYLVECAWRSLKPYQKLFAGVKGERVSKRSSGTWSSTWG